ncbi:MAG TPA: hypothetical protein VNT26_16035 [Candidatus Sulfotelmatobacter sp.]|nr:hypothetical protein [Candidatus Sulfotelmatobacter sp.]
MNWPKKGAAVIPCFHLLLRKVLSLVVAGLLLGWAYEWAAARFYRTDHTAGFGYGTLHGALMPAALPSLVLGKDVPIFTANNTGRTYKLGYIAGINLCGLIFFGLAFRKPKSDDGMGNQAKSSGQNQGAFIPKG